MPHREPHQTGEAARSCGGRPGWCPPSTRRVFSSSMPPTHCLPPPWRRLWTVSANLWLFVQLFLFHCSCALPLAITRPYKSPFPTNASPSSAPLLQCFCGKWNAAAKKCTGVRAHPTRTSAAALNFPRLACPLATQITRTWTPASGMPPATPAAAAPAPAGSPASAPSQGNARQVGPLEASPPAPRGAPSSCRHLIWPWCLGHHGHG